MAGANSIRAGRAHVETGVDNNGLSAGLRAASAKLKAFGSSLQAVGSSMLGVGISAAVPFALATQSFATFESAMARVQALTNASAGDFASLTTEAQRLGATTVYSASEAAKAMGVFALAGYKTHDIIKATGPALQLAAAGQMDLAQAADISMKVMSGMGIATEDLGGTIDVLAKAMTTANTDLIMLGDAFKYVGPVARSAGMSLEETTAAIQVLSDAGIQADMAGTTLRGAILSLTSPSEEARKALKEMGVEVMDSRGNFRGLTAIIGDMEEALKGLGTGRRLQLIGDVFANRQATGISTLIDRGAGELRTKTADLGTAPEEGTSGRIAKTQLDTLYGAWKLLESAMEGVGNIVGEALAPTIREWGSAIIGGVGVFGAILKENKAWIPTIAKTGAALFLVGGAITAVGLGFLGVGAVIAGLATGLTLVLTPIFAIGTAIGALFTPVGLVVAAIGAGVVAFATLTDSGKAMTADLGRYFSNLGSTFMSTIGSIGATFGQAWGGILDAVKAGDLGLAGRIAWKGLEIVWMKGVNWISGLWRGFSNFFVDVFAEAGGMLVKGINLIWGGLELMWFDSFATVGKAWGSMLDGMLKSYYGFVYQSQLAWIAWQNSVGAMSNHNRTLQETIAYSGDTTSDDPEKRKGYTTRLREINATRQKVDKENEDKRRDIVKRKEGVDKGIDDDLGRGRKEREAAGLRAVEAEAVKLAEAEAELAKAIKEAAHAAKMAEPLDRSIFESDGELMLKAPTKQGLDAASERATGMGSNGGSAGTFDANMLRFLAGTGNEDILQKRQAEAAEKAAERLQRLIDIARENTNTYT